MPLARRSRVDETGAASPADLAGLPRSARPGSCCSHVRFSHMRGGTSTEPWDACGYESRIHADQLNGNLRCCARPATRRSCPSRSQSLPP